MSHAAAPQRELLVISDAQEHGDDAVAVLMLLQAGLRPRALLATAGNVWAEQAQSNLLRMFAATGHAAPRMLCGPPPGAYAPRLQLHRERRDGAAVLYAGALAHPVPAGAADTNLESVGATAIAAMAPLTALARMLQREPGLPSTVKDLYVLGGALEQPGNATPAAEFNFWFDAEAAAAVLAAGFRITLVPLDCTASVLYSPASVARLAASASPAARWANAYLQRRGARPLQMWDEVLAGIIIEPGLVRAVEELPLSVECRPGADYGRLQHGGHPVRVVRAVDVDGLNSLLCRLLDPT